MLLVVDANVLVGELLRVRGREVFERGILRLHISEQALDEALHEMARRAARIVERGRASRQAADAMLDELVFWTKQMTTARAARSTALLAA